MTLDEVEATADAVEEVPPTEDEIAETRRQLMGMGFGWFTRVPHGEKQPTDGLWSSRTVIDTTPMAGYQLGVQGGTFQPGYSLVIVDLDHMGAVDRANEFLPKTDMIEGRRGKPRSHRYFVVPNDTIPEPFWSTCKAADVRTERFGHPGPKKKFFRGPGGGVAIDFLGTGGQAVTAPALHHSGELRTWEGGTPGVPSLVDFNDLWNAVTCLAAAIGGAVAGDDPAAEAAADAEADAAPADGLAALPTPAGEPRVKRDPAAGKARHPQWREPRPDGESPYALTDPAELARATEKARNYIHHVATTDPPRSGKGGDVKTYRLVKTLVVDFRLPRAVALDVLHTNLEVHLVALNDGWAGYRNGYEYKVACAIAEAPGDGYEVGGLLAGKGDGNDVLRGWNDPDRRADAFLADRGTRPLVRLGDTFYQREGGAYKPAADEDVKAELRRHLTAASDAEFRRAAKGHAGAVAAAEKAVAEAKAGVAAAKAAEDATAGPGARQDAVRDVTAANKTLAAAEEALEKLRAKGAGWAPPVTNAFAADVLGAVAARVQLPRGTQPGAWLGGKAGPPCVGVANGLLRLDTLELIPDDPDCFNLWALPVAFDPAAPAPAKWLDVLNTLHEGDADRVAIVQELFGACLDPFLTEKFFVAMPGGGDNGKSVVLKVLATLLGAGNVSAVPLNDLTGNRFAAFNMVGKLANLVGDQAFFQSDDEGRLKQLTSGDLYPFEQKGKQPVEAVNTAKVVFAANTLPTFKDGTDATWNRLIVLPFRYTVPKAAQDKSLLTPAAWGAELPGVLNWAIEGLKRLRANGFTTSAVCEAAKAEHRDASDAVGLFVRTTYAADRDGFVKSLDLRAAWGRWAIEHGFKFEPANITLKRALGKMVPGIKCGSRYAKDEKKNVSGWPGIRERAADEPAGGEPPALAA